MEIQFSNTVIEASWFKAIGTKYGFLKQERNLWEFVFKGNLEKQDWEEE